MSAGEARRFFNPVSKEEIMGNTGSAMDDWLRRFDQQYATWVDQGGIEHASRVIPVKESLESAKWVLPSQQALEIIKNSFFIALNSCICRSHYQRCDKPRDVCLLFDDYGKKIVDKGIAREITLEEAEKVLDAADREGLVHLSLYRPDHKLYALCSCCSCCCHDLQLLMKHGRTHLVAQGEYLAVNDDDACTNCGACVDRCVFGARVMEGYVLKYDPDKCYGCGLCLSVCPVNAISLALKDINLPSGQAPAEIAR